MSLKLKKNIKDFSFNDVAILAQVPHAGRLAPPLWGLGGLSWPPRLKQGGRGHRDSARGWRAGGAARRDWRRRRAQRGAGTQPSGRAGDAWSRRREKLHGRGGAQLLAATRAPALSEGAQADAAAGHTRTVAPERAPAPSPVRGLGHPRALAAVEEVQAPCIDVGVELTCGDQIDAEVVYEALEACNGGACAQASSFSDENCGQLTTSALSGPRTTGTTPYWWRTHLGAARRRRGRPEGGPRGIAGDGFDGGGPTSRRLRALARPYTFHHPPTGRARSTRKGRSKALHIHTSSSS